MSKFANFLAILAAVGLTPELFAAATANDTPDEVGYKKVKLIAKAYNGDWVPDFANDEEWKHEPRFYHNGTEFVFYRVTDWIQYSRVGSRLCFRDENDAEEAATVFIAEYREFLS